MLHNLHVPVVPNHSSQPAYQAAHILFVKSTVCIQPDDFEASHCT